MPVELVPDPDEGAWVTSGRMGGSPVCQAQTPAHSRTGQRHTREEAGPRPAPLRGSLLEEKPLALPSRNWGQGSDRQHWECG